MESLDYRYHRVTYNKHSARYFADGTVRVIVCAEDPNAAATQLGAPSFVGNWVDTCGHAEGTMTWRWVKVAPAHDGPRLPHPRTRVVPVAALAGLPEGC